MIKLTRQQIAAMFSLSLQVEWKYDGAMTFSIYPETFADGSIMFCGTNIHSDDHEWFMKSLNFTAFITPRGRIRVGSHSDWRQWGARGVRLRADTFKLAKA